MFSNVQFKGKVIQDWENVIQGEILITKFKISFLGDVDQATGSIVASDSDIRGLNISSKIFIFLESRGSTVGSNVLFGLSKRNLAPKLIITCKPDLVVASGAIFGNIPMISEVDEKVFEFFKNGDIAKAYIYKNAAFLEKVNALNQRRRENP
jgi:predicted aconitase with swiveling domain